MGGGIFDVIKTLLFVSNSPYWFMRTYFCLYVISPLINRLLDQSNTKQWIGIIISLSIVAVYIGMIHFDDSLNAGKNVVNFTLIYVLGATVKKYEMWKLFKRQVYLIAYLGLNAIEMLVYMIFAGNLVGEAFHYGCFQYCSPVLMLNAMMLLCYFLNLNFQSRAVNWLANSALAIYLVHTLILYSVIAPVAQSVYEYNSNFVFVFPVVVVFTALISLGCIFVDKLLTPVWWAFSKTVPILERLMVKIIQREEVFVEKLKEKNFNR